MSTYYYMSCEDHKERTKIIAVGRLVGKHIDNADHLLQFLEAHRHCPLRYFSEHDEHRYEYKKFEEIKRHNL